MGLNGIDEDSLLDLYAENFAIDGATLRDLADAVDYHEDDRCGGVAAGIEDFVYSRFYADMVGRCKNGVTFDEYVGALRFPHDREAFMGYLRDVWDVAASLSSHRPVS